MNYLELKNLIISYSHRTDLDTTLIDNFVELTAVMIGRDCRMIEQEREATLNFTDEAGLPEGYASMRSVSRQDANRLQGLDCVSSAMFNKTAAQFENSYTIRNQKIVINGEGTVTLNYFIRPPELKADLQFNFVLVSAPHLYLYGALKEIGVYAQDQDAVNMYGALYNDEVDRVNIQADEQRYSGSMATKRVD